jgi:hypothetical protein
MFMATVAIILWVIFLRRVRRDITTENLEEGWWVVRGWFG